MVRGKVWFSYGCPQWLKSPYRNSHTIWVCVCVCAIISMPVTLKSACAHTPCTCTHIHTVQLKTHQHLDTNIHMNGVGFFYGWKYDSVGDDTSLKVTDRNWTSNYLSLVYKCVCVCVCMYKCTCTSRSESSWIKLWRLALWLQLLVTPRYTFILRGLCECVFCDEADSLLPNTPYMVNERATSLQRGRISCQSHRPVKKLSCVEVGGSPPPTCVGKAADGGGCWEQVAMVTVEQGHVLLSGCLCRCGETAERIRQREKSRTSRAWHRYVPAAPRAAEVHELTHSDREQVCCRLGFRSGKLKSWLRQMTEYLAVSAFIQQEGPQNPKCDVMKTGKEQ